MRIIAGKMRGKRLALVGQGDASAHLRPTTDRVRESLFNLLINGGYGAPINGARVLDLFAGTGALGLEALSRGASFAMFVDNGPTAQSLLKQNIALCNAQPVSKINRRDAAKLGPNTTLPFDLVFLDPPYGKSMGERTLEAALQGNWLAPEALIVWEESAPPTLSADFEGLDQRRYGTTIITIARRRPL
jgi:16S rRNA (guanine966-N2)-methyltransferase